MMSENSTSAPDDSLQMGDQKFVKKLQTDYPEPSLWNSQVGRRAFLKKTGMATAGTVIILHGFRTEVLASGSGDKPVLYIYTYTVYYAGKDPNTNQPTWSTTPGLAQPVPPASSIPSAPATGTPVAPTGSGTAPTGIDTTWGTGLLSTQVDLPQTQPLKAGFPTVSTTGPTPTSESGGTVKGYIYTVVVTWEYGT